MNFPRGVLDTPFLWYTQCGSIFEVKIMTRAALLKIPMGLEMTCHTCVQVKTW